MTKEEIEDNYEFKVVKRLLKKEYPFIKDMKLTHDWENYSSQYFIELDMNLTEVFNLLDIPIDTKTTKFSNIFPRYPYLTIYFTPQYNDIVDDLAKRVKKTIKRIQSSPSIPPDMKLHKDLTISTWTPIGQVDIPKQTYPQDNVDN